tara:strand:+ start:23192 stop:23341 length:150 start_codon:yes stop_codon:yes gene_type:complete
MELVAKYGSIEIWRVTESHGDDFYVYASDKLVRVCPSIGMAREIAAGAA